MKAWRWRLLAAGSIAAVIAIAALPSLLPDPPPRRSAPLPRPPPSPPADTAPPIPAAQPVETDPRAALLRCELPSSFPALVPTPVEFAVDGAPPFAGDGTIDGRRLAARVPEGDGKAEIDVRGVGRMELWWKGARTGAVTTCTMVVMVAGYTGVVGDVVGPLRGSVRVEGCGGSGPVEPDGTFFLDVRTGPCQLRVVAEAGGHVFEGPPIDVDPKVGQDLEVTLTSPIAARVDSGAP